MSPPELEQSPAKEQQQQTVNIQHSVCRLPSACFANNNGVYVWTIYPAVTLTSGWIGWIPVSSASSLPVRTPSDKPAGVHVGAQTWETPMWCWGSSHSPGEQKWQQSVSHSMLGFKIKYYKRPFGRQEPKGKCVTFSVDWGLADNKAIVKTPMKQRFGERQGRRLHENFQPHLPVG